MKAPGGLVQALVLGGSCLLIVSWPDLEDKVLVDVDDNWKGKAALMEAGRPAAEKGREELGRGRVTLLEDREGLEVELLVLEVSMEGQEHEEEGRLVLEADNHQQDVVGE